MGKKTRCFGTGQRPDKGVTTRSSTFSRGCSKSLLLVLRGEERLGNKRRLSDG